MLPIFVVILVSVSNLVIAIIVFYNNRNSATNRLLALLSVINALWTVFNYLALYSGPEEIKLFWVRAVMMATSPFGPVIYLLARAFPKQALNVRPRIFFVISLITLTTAIFAATPLMFAGLKNLPGGNFELKLAPAIALYGFNLIGFMVLGFYELIKKFKGSRGLEKLQLSYFLFGIVVTFTLSTITNFIAVAVFGTIKLTYLGPPMTLVLIGAVVYAIMKHRLLNIRLLIVRSITYSALLLIIALIYTVVIFLISNFLVSRILPSIQNIANDMVRVILMLFIALSFQNLKEYIKKITDKFLYKNEYNPNLLLSELNNIISKTLNLNELISRTLTEIVGNMRLTKGAIFIFKKESIYPPAIIGFTDKITYDYKTLYSIAQLRKFILLQEEDAQDILAQEVLGKQGIVVALPIQSRGEIYGLFLLGEKQSGELYTEKDVELLEIFEPAMAVALENAKAYEEIKNFNVTLQGKIKKATFDLQKANEHLKELDKLKDEFLSLASHELRTPLGIIKNYLWMVLYKDQSLSEDTKAKLRHAFDSSESLILLINDMLDVSRIEGNRINLAPVRIDMTQFIKEIDEDMTLLAKDKGINLSVLSEKNLFIKADKDKVKQVVINLIGNAIKFTPDSGKIIINLKKVNNAVEIDVKDSGFGIKKEDLPKLFTKFGRLEGLSSRTTKISGTGLGLYISKKIIELCGGKIWVNSEFGKGSTFSFTLPSA